MLTISLLSLASVVAQPNPGEQTQAREEQRLRCSDESADRDNERVVASCTALLLSSGSDGEARFLALSHRARAYVRMSDYGRALPDFREAMRLEPNDYRMLNGFCWSLAVRGEDLVEARTACDAALRLHPDDPQILDSRGLVSLKQGRNQDAWTDYNRAVSIEPRGLSWLYGRGIAAIRLGRVEEGLRDIASAEAQYPPIKAMYESYEITPQVPAPRL